MNKKQEKFIKLMESVKPKGGLSDGLSTQDIADKHDVPYDEIVSQLIKGTDVEMEHTNDKELSKKIAMDHLVEDPKYYDKLKNIEESVENKKHILSKQINNYTVDVYKIIGDVQTFFIFSISDGDDVYDSPKIKNNKAKGFYNNILKYINMNLSSKEILASLEYHLNESKSSIKESEDIGRFHVGTFEHQLDNGEWEYTEVIKFRGEKDRTTKYFTGSAVNDGSVIPDKFGKYVSVDKYSTEQDALEQLYDWWVSYISSNDKKEKKTV